MNQKTPEVRITHSRFLDPIFKAHMASRPTLSAITPISTEETGVLVETYKKAWEKEEMAILNGMTDILSIGFYQNTIDVYLVPYHNGSFSSPMVIGMISRGQSIESNMFVDVLTHELLHRLFTDNDKGIRFGRIWLDMFPDEEMLTRNHIFLHAVHAHIYLNILKNPSRMEKNIVRHSVHAPYKKAWDIVEKQGYNTLIEELKKRY